MNNVVIMGRITRELELRIVRNDLAVLGFSIALNERRKDREETHYFDITAFGKQAEIIERYFKKGDRILVTGRLRQERFNDKEGNSRSKVSVILDQFDFIEPKGTDTSSSSPSTRQTASRDDSLSSFSDVPDIDDDVPF